MNSTFSLYTMGHKTSPRRGVDDAKHVCMAADGGHFEHTM